MLSTTCASRYALEVSSPGLDRPLRTAGAVRRASGREVYVKTAPSPRRARGLPGPAARVRSRQSSPWRSTKVQAVDIPFHTIAKAHVIFEFDDNGGHVSREIIEALRQIEKEKGISAETLSSRARGRVAVRLQEDSRRRRDAKVEIDTETGDMRVFQLIFPDHVDVESLKVHETKRARRSASTSRRST